MKKKTRKKIPRTSAPQIFAYQDYRPFLRDWCAHLKQTQPGFSMRAVAREAGLASGYLPMVIAGKRNISADVLERLLPRLHLTVNQQSYFKVLSQMTDSQSQDNSADALQKAQRFHDFQKYRSRESEVYRYMTKWYYVTIREMVALPEFRPDPKWIQSRLAYYIPTSEVAKALEFLIDNSFIEVKKDGTCRLTEKDISCEGSVFSVALGQYHREMLGKVAPAIDQFPSKFRNISGLTLPLSKAGFEKVKTVLARAMEELEAIAADEKNPDAIYHAGLIGIPMTSPDMETKLSTKKIQGGSADEKK
ncbi:MAG: TIGR02147 family protein [Bdellovibrionia bacterium]